MSFLKRFFVRLRNSTTTPHDERLKEEIAEHIALQTAENLRAGLSPSEARRQALLKFGAVEAMKEDYQAERRFLFFDTLLQDIRYALRMLRKSPGFTAVAVLTLALGIGANTAIFSLLDGVMLRSLPVRDPGQLVVLQWTAHRHFMQGNYSSFSDCGATAFANPSGCSFPLPIYEQIRSQTNTFSGVLACAGPADLDLSGSGPARVVRGEIVSGDYFSVLGVNAVIGRTIESSDDSVSAPPAVVLSSAYWQSMFGGSRSVLGRAILLNNVAFTIIGVAEPRFTSLSPGKTQDLWLPIAMAPRLHISWAGRIEGFTNWWLLVIARLKPGVSLSRGQAAASLTFHYEVLYGPEPLARESDDPGILLTRAQEGLIGRRGQLSTMLYVLMFAVGLILLIACANIAGLLLSRASNRQSEMAIRLALGGGHGRILRQLLTESTLLSISGGVLGIAFAYWGTHAIVAAIVGNSDVPFPYAIAPDWRILSFTLGISVLTGMAFGVAPAIRATRLELGPTLKETVSALPAGPPPRWLRLGSMLVVAQIALSVVVLIGASLLVRTLQNLQNLNPGFETRNILIFKIMPGEFGYTKAQIENLFAELRVRLAAIPAVTSVTCSSLALLTGGYWIQRVHVEGQPQDAEPWTHMFGAGPGFFRTMHISLLEGRRFASSDFEQTEQSLPNTAIAKTPASVANVIVNEAFVRSFFADHNPLGKIINNRHTSVAGGGAWDVTPKSSDWRIVGVVSDSKYGALREEIQPVIYVPFTSARGGFFELRTATDPRTLIPTVRDIAGKLDANLPLTDVHTQTQEISGLMSQERLIARVSGFFGALALLLVCIGLYGLLSYQVTRRTREIGIRMALGSEQRSVIRLLLEQGTTLALTGIIIGVLGALGSTRFIARLLFGVSPADSLIFAGVSGVLLAVALAACYIPARRATKVDPMVALRYE